MNYKNLKFLIKLNFIILHLLIQNIGFFFNYIIKGYK